VSGDAAASKAERKRAARQADRILPPPPPLREFPRREPGQTLKYWVEVVGWLFWSAWAFFQRWPRWIRILLIVWVGVTLLNRGCGRHHDDADEFLERGAVKKTGP
jgi:hypothetical protein